MEELDSFCINVFVLSHLLGYTMKLCPSGKHTLQLQAPTCVLSKALIICMKYFLKSKYSITANRLLQKQLQEYKGNIIKVSSMQHVFIFFFFFFELCNKYCDLASSCILFEHLTLVKLPISKSKPAKTCFPLSSEQKTNQLCEQIV